MQQLRLEPAWDRTLSTNDRQHIENIFQETKHIQNSSIIFSSIREAINHSEALLITVLIHNGTDQTLTFHNKKLQYKIRDEVIGDQVFTLPALSIPSKVSTPWTFIYPKGSYKQSVPFKSGKLNII
ncbi:SLAP domain-containing protein [Sutcliffiella cohnii]|uniref:SLAP domain-containing protein n=1 Tax=Sutcliffiella cohnii TaxID=33932 RepID=UPI002E1ECB3F|nr:SLAP domain-containing protein [Sutcliffiella cohnii]